MDWIDAPVGEEHSTSNGTRQTGWRLPSTTKCNCKASDAVGTVVWILDFPTMGTYHLEFCRCRVPTALFSCCRSDIFSIITEWGLWCLFCQCAVATIYQVRHYWKVPTCFSVWRWPEFFFSYMYKHRHRLLSLLWRRIMPTFSRYSCTNLSVRWMLSR